MTTHAVTLANWDDPAFWSSISEGAGGHTLDFSGLPSNFNIDVDKATGTVTLTDGATTFTVGEAGFSGASDVTLGGGTLWDFFQTMSFGNGDQHVTGDAQSETFTTGAGADTVDGAGGDDLIDGGAGADSLIGGLGDDTISGGIGAGVTPSFTDVANGNVATGTTGTDYFRWLAEPGANATITLDDGAGGDRTGDGAADYVLVATTNDTNTLALRGFDYGADRIVLPDAIASISENATFHGGNQWSFTATVTYTNGNTQAFNIEMEGTGPVTAGQIFTTSPPWGNADYIEGNAGDDSLTAHDGNDTVLGGDGDDVLVTGTGADLASGDADADRFVIEDGFGDDTLTGGEGTTTGSDSDTIDGSALTGAVTVSLDGDEQGTITDGSDTIAFSQIENVFTGAGDDSIDASLDGMGLGLFGFDGNDTISGGAGDDTLDGGGDADYLAGGTGDDSIFGAGGNDLFIVEDDFGNDTIDGDSASETTGDTLDASGVTQDLVLDLGQSGAADPESGLLSNGTDFADFTDIENIFLGAGDDLVFGSTGADTVSTGAGNDTIDGGDGADSFDAGAGDDSITVDQGDTVTGGDGDDTFRIADLDTSGTGNAAVDITGGEGGETTGDTLILTPDVSRDDITFTNTDDAAGGLSGNFAMTDGTVVSFSEIENIICFTPGTMILTSHGERPIETLRPGDMVVTRDQGLRPIRWIGRRTVRGHGRFAPIRVGANALDSTRNGLLVSPQHRILYTGYRAELLFGDSEVLVPAKHLVDGKDVQRQPCDEVTYIHLMFDHHEVIYAEGIATESFHAGDAGLGAIDAPAREELFSLFPELRTAPGNHLDTARTCLKKHEAALLVDDTDDLHV